MYQDYYQTQTSAIPALALKVVNIATFNQDYYAFECTVNESSSAVMQASVDTREVKINLLNQFSNIIKDDFDSLVAYINDELLDALVKDHSIKLSQLTPDSLNHERNGLYDLLLSNDRILFYMLQDEVEQELTLNHLEYGTNNNKRCYRLAYSLQNTLNRYFRSNDINKKLAGSWLPYFHHHPIKRWNNSFKQLHSSLVEDACLNGKVPHKRLFVSNMSYLAIRDRYEQLNAHHRKKSRKRWLGIAALLCLGLGIFSVSDTSTWGNVAQKAKEGPKQLWQSVSQNWQKADVGTKGTVSTLTSGLNNASAKETLTLPVALVSGDLEGLLLDGLTNKTKEAFQIGFYNVGASGKNLLFDYTVVKEGNRGTNKSGGTQLSGRVDLDNMMMILDPYYINGRKIALQYGQLLKNRQGLFFIESDYPDLRWKAKENKRR